jgi:hypothetical protein
MGRTYKNAVLESLERIEKLLAQILAATETATSGQMARVVAADKLVTGADAQAQSFDPKS